MSTSRVYTVGQVLTAAQVNDLPQGVLGITRVTTASASIGATETDLITAPAVTVAGTSRRLRIAFHATGINQTVSGDTHQFAIKEGATFLQRANATTSAISTDDGCNFEAYVDSPTAASHTYKATLVRTAGTGTAQVIAGSDFPMTIVVEDVGQV